MFGLEVDHGISGTLAGCGQLGSISWTVFTVRPSLLFTPSKSDFKWFIYGINSHIIASHGISRKPAGG